MTGPPPENYLQFALQRLDLLLHRQILRLRASYQLSLDEFRGLYISDQQVDDLLNMAASDGSLDTSIAELTAQADELRHQQGDKNNSSFELLAEKFALSDFEQDVLLLAVAPEIDLKYETLYAYLNNDVTRKYPTIDLAIKVCTENAEERAVARSYLDREASLFSKGHIEPVESAPGQHTWLATGFKTTPCIRQYLQGLQLVDPLLNGVVRETCSLATWDDVPCPESTTKQVKNLAVLFNSEDTNSPILHFKGTVGIGKRVAAEALCRELGFGLLKVDCRLLAASDEKTLQQQSTRLMTWAQLTGSGLYLQDIDLLQTKAHLLAKAFASVNNNDLPMFVTTSEQGAKPGLSGTQPVFPVEFAEPATADRMRLWQNELQERGFTVFPETLQVVVERFLLTPLQIKQAAQEAVYSHLLSAEQGRNVAIDHLMEAARSQTTVGLGHLSTKVPLLHGWHDLVLPDATRQRVQDVVAAIKNRHLVYGKWGFGRRLANRNGLMVLFGGASGTGKTMTAGVIAREIGLDLYRIDLSSVVSKYIGETEKNLDRVFQAAHRANVILFFDEADALFGKRSEVKDAHDRYANIEISYLLQKMEEHDGVVILASNLSKNIDQAFSRRMQYVIDFPRPDEVHRKRLWQGMVPAETPLGEDVDLPFLARQFELTGGEIRNVVLDSAFMAAENGKVIRMEQIVKAMARQMVKQGRMPGAMEFKQYHGLLT